jgi:hypothetical protein
MTTRRQRCDVTAVAVVDVAAADLRLSPPPLLP